MDMVGTTTQQFHNAYQTPRYRNNHAHHADYEQAEIGVIHSTGFGVSQRVSDKVSQQEISEIYGSGNHCGYYSQKQSLENV